MSDAAAYLASAVLLGLAGYRIVVDRKASPYSPRSSLYGFVICQGAAMALLATATSNLLTRIGVGALYVVLAGEIVRTAAISFLMLVGFALEPSRARMGTSATGAPTTRTPPAALAAWPAVAPPFVLPAALLVQVAMTATFLAARPTTTADWELRVRGAGRWLFSTHDALFAGYAVWALIVVIGALAGEARRVGPGRLQLGLRLTLAAAAVGILWSAWTADDIANVLSSGVQDGSEDTLSNVLGAVCATLVVAGATVAKWGDALAAPLRWVRAYRTYARLGPLWSALRTELPQIALADRPRWLGALLPSGTEFALYRRVIEIHDGRLALRPYAYPRTEVAAALALSPHSPQSPHSSEPPESSEDWNHLVEAASIAAALANLRAGRRLDAGVVDAGSVHAGAGTDSSAADAAQGPAGSVDAEAAWLLGVSEALTCTVVSAAVRRLAESSA